MRIIKKILGVFCLIMLITGVFLLFSEKASRGGTIMTIVLFGVLAHILLFRKEKKATQQETGTLEKPNITAYLAHVNGLPIPENTYCNIATFPDRMEFKAGTTNITLMREKITDMVIKTDTEIQKQIVSSTGGAIAGAVLFGPLGAIIGFDTKGSLKQFKLINEFKKLNTTEGFNIGL